MFTLLLLIFACCLNEANLHSPRMVFKYKEAPVKRFPLREHLPVQILFEEWSANVTSVEKTRLAFYNFNNTRKVAKDTEVQWKDCPRNDCKIAVVHQREEGKPLFVCATKDRTSQCCDLDSSGSLTCAKIDNINTFNIKEGEKSALDETDAKTDLYLTSSGAHENVGIHKFGSKRVRPVNHGKEQYYLGLVLSKRQDEPLQNKVYSFYKQKNKDTSPGSNMWLPFVSQVCMADMGGPKNNLQFSWTSLMNARLYCGHNTADNKRHFFELVDVATVHSDHWKDTRVYALFRNEWGMSAVCVYTIGDIENVFTRSPFIDSDKNEEDRKKCVLDSTKLSTSILGRVEKVLEMKEWVKPRMGPVLFNHHNYTRILVDASPGNQHDVMFLSLSNGAIHKAIQLESHSFIIAEYQPFNYSAHILNFVLNPSTKKLYVNSQTELVQIDVGNCGQYGNNCPDCVLSRDPYCSWEAQQCTSATSGASSVVHRNHSMCSEDLASPLRRSAGGPKSHVDNSVKSMTVPSESSCFLRCPVSSHHAQYTWKTPENSSSCYSRDGQCLLLIDSMTPSQQGVYKCESEEMGYRKVLVQYELRCSSAGQTFSSTVWIFIAAVFNSVWF
ncbi:semaphorin-7A [Poecilia latipinna]|uniref:semaphorin-7A n=1 Tax=Poecilia latipinna TaxID=48699 RepID=UPI00072E5A1F|nr:PREDICTED: semaphorin-7A-like [Poecilia latipinna]